MNTNELLREAADWIESAADETDDASGAIAFAENIRAALAESNRIRIIVSGGLIQEVQNIPAGVVVEVWDYDVERDDSDGVEFDSIGDPVVKSEWFPDKEVTR